jgi:predicted small metal-binding protein
MENPAYSAGFLPLCIETLAAPYAVCHNRKKSLFIILFAMTKHTVMRYTLSCNLIGWDCPFSIASGQADEAVDRMMRHMKRAEHFNDYPAFVEQIGGEEKLEEFLRSKMQSDQFDYEM